MWLSEIEADRLRNLRAVHLALPAGMTLVTGRNGQGKTSLLEAVYLLATGRSFRTRRLEEIVAWEGGPLRVAGAVASRLGQSRLVVHIDEERRTLVADGGEKDLQGYLGRLDLVDLTAPRMEVLRGAPVDRRRFLDRGIVGLEPSWLSTLASYRRALQHRNALLRRGRRGAAGRDPHLEAWDERVVETARRIHEGRRRYAVRLGSLLGPAIRAMFPDGQGLSMSYRPSPAAAREREPALFPDVFREALAQDQKRDFDVGHTCRGPHRDDLRIELDGVDLRRYGSAGQVRAAMIALKLGKMCLLREERGEAPIFLMDDFDTDLDEGRAAALAGFMTGGGFQVLAATSKEAMADRLGVDFVKVRVDGGVARPT